MDCTDAGLAFVDTPAPAVRLEDLDTTTLRALCDGGWLDHKTYVAIARSRGVVVAEPARPVPIRAAPLQPADGEDVILIALPAGTPLNDIERSLDLVGGRIAGRLSDEGRRLSLPVSISGERVALAVSLAMQHQRRTELPQAMLA